MVALAFCFFCGVSVFSQYRLVIQWLYLRCSIPVPGVVVAEPNTWVPQMEGLQQRRIAESQGVLGVCPQETAGTPWIALKKAKKLHEEKKVLWNLKDCNAADGGFWMEKSESAVKKTSQYRVKKKLSQSFFTQPSIPSMSFSACLFLDKSI